MRVCIVTHSLYESDGRVMRYAEVLAARGDDVEVFALRKEGKAAEEVLAGVRVYRIQYRDFKEKKRASFLKGVGAFFLRSFWYLTKQHLRNPYDVIHVNSIPDFMVFVALVPKLMGVKVLLDIHDILPELYASKFGVSHQSIGFRAMLFLERISIAFSDHVIIANHIWLDRLIERNPVKDRCTVLLNYPDRSIFRPVERTPREEFLILYPGTLNIHQGLDVAIRAFAKIESQVKHATFLIHGEGREQDNLIALVRKLGVEGRVKFGPMLPVRQIAAILASADLAVVPKRKDGFGNEAFSTKIFEFMSSGVPVIVSDTKIDKYYFNDSVVTFFRDGDEEDLGRKIVRMVGDASLRETQAKAASEFVRAYDWEVNKFTYIAIIDALTPAARGKSVPETPEKSLAASNKADI